MIEEPGDPNCTPPVPQSSHLQTDDELTTTEIKQVEANNQAIQTILMGLPEDIYAAVDNCNNDKEIWLRVQQMMKGNQNGYNAVQNLGNQNGNGNVVAAQADGNGNGNNANQIRCYNYRGVRHYAKNYTIEKVNANCILMANLQQASTSGNHADKAPINDSNRLAEVHQYENCYNNEIFNMFAQEEQYNELLESTTDLHLVQQDDSNVILADSNMDPSGGEVEHHPATIKETRAFYESLYNNLVIEVEKVNTVNREIKEANVKLTAELARYMGRGKSFEFNQAKFDELENGYRKSVYQEQCLTKKINALHLSSSKMINALS
ncbi:hypothetical protein Tco_0797700 [Tanacetum coccineum]